MEFQQLFEPLYRQCHALARRLVGNDLQAEAAATEALARAYAKWARVRSLPHPEGWVLRMTGVLAAEALAADVRAASELGRAVASLTPQLRDAIVLRYLTALEVDEVALVLRMTPEAVRATVHEGLSQLRLREAGSANVFA